MAQLLKVQDYISRYEKDVYHYTSQFNHLKKHNWKKAKQLFEDGLLHEPPVQEEIKAQRSFLQKAKERFTRKKETCEVEEAFSSDSVGNQELLRFTTLPQTAEDLKILFLENVFDLQMKWATSTLFEFSQADRKYYHDEALRYFIQRFPDTCLVMYKPVFMINKAPVEGDIVIVTPTETLCICLIETYKSAVFQYSKENFWTELRGRDQKKILNPLIGLNRTEQIVRSIYRTHDIEHNVKKILLSRNGYIDYAAEPYQVEFVDARKYEEWFYELRKSKAPLKFKQMKAAQVLLEHSQSIYFDREFEAGE
ncbi:hypothetical protein ABE322_18265 [Priestia megaterium]